MNKEITDIVIECVKICVPYVITINVILFTFDMMCRLIFGRIKK